MKTIADYKSIVNEMTQVLAHHKLDAKEASYVSMMLFLEAVDNDLKQCPESYREKFCHRLVHHFFDEKRKAKSQMN